ncbi:MAG: NnrS family protein [Verrucomicrobiota bacterium]
MILIEPYRGFFPLGVLVGMGGALLWPLYYGHWLGFNPIDAHPRMMIEGFMAAFVLGFLGTAFPRLAGNRPWLAGEFLLLLGLWASGVACAATGRVAAADGVFAGLLGVLVCGLGWRWACGNRDTPPPGLVLALGGLLGGAVAAACLAWQHGLWLGASGLAWAKLWLFQGFLLLPVMGIGPYVLPRFFGQPSSHTFEDAPRPPAGWWPRVGSALFWGLHIVASFALEVGGYPQIGQLLRAGVLGVWFALETPVFRRAKLSSTSGNVVRLALGGMITGWGAAAFWPGARPGLLHLCFISGFGLIALAVGTRVVLGHAGQHVLLVGRMRWLRWLAVLLVLTAVTRMSADFLPKVRVSHHIYAAWTWIAAGMVWLCALTRRLWQREDKPAPRSKCPRRR